MNVFKKSLLTAIFFSLKKECSQFFKTLKSKFSFLISFFVVLFFYSPFLFSDPYRETSESRAVQIDEQPPAKIFSSGLVGNAEKTDKCSILPEIASAVVYQSVEAPQIEPLSAETNPYNDYDLVVPIIVNLPQPSSYLTDEKLRDDLRLIVREISYKIEPVRNRNALIKKISFTKESESELSQTGRIIYESEIDWSATFEDLIIRRER